MFHTLNCAGSLIVGSNQEYISFHPSYRINVNIDINIKRSGLTKPSNFR